MYRTFVELFLLFFFHPAILVFHVMDVDRHDDKCVLEKLSIGSRHDQFLKQGCGRKRDVQMRTEWLIALADKKPVVYLIPRDQMGVTLSLTKYCTVKPTRVELRRCYTSIGC
jgi:hypothetical protein